MKAYIHWPHFTSSHKVRTAPNGKTQVWVEANGGRWRWYTVNKGKIRCDGSLITCNVREEA